MNKFEYAQRRIFLEMTTDHNRYHEDKVTIEEVNSGEVRFTVDGKKSIMLPFNDRADLVGMFLDNHSGIRDAYEEYLKEKAKPREEAWVCPGWDELGQYGPRSEYYENMLLTDTDAIKAEIEMNKEYESMSIEEINNNLDLPITITKLEAGDKVSNGHWWTYISAHYVTESGEEDSISIYPAGQPSVDKVIECLTYEFNKEDYIVEYDSPFSDDAPF
ncbi:MAG: hypothetical protein ACRDCE_01495 [Cetobacterium sp.]|uniref:hypothetical protein n=1 Tax=Cetobacterium sp. TaxID=2071632 RepID=UPI003EE70EF3